MLCNWPPVLMDQSLNNSKDLEIKVKKISKKKLVVLRLFENKKVSLGLTE